MEDAKQKAFLTHHRDQLAKAFDRYAEDTRDIPDEGCDCLFCLDVRGAAEEMRSIIDGLDRSIETLKAIEEGRV